MDGNISSGKIRLEEVTVGTDCEVFAYDPIQNEFRSCVGLIGGMKGFPIDIGEKCGLEEDNVAAEFTVPPVSLVGGENDMYKSIQHCLSEIQRRLHESYEIKIVPSAIFPKGELNTPQAVVFGCEPDFNAWANGCPNPKPRASNRHLRSCGGHIHIGYPNPTFEKNLEIVQALDLFLTLPGLAIDKDTQRRELYGKAGAFRDKPYGVEYRSISNFWITDKEYVDWVFRAIADAINFVNEGTSLADDATKIVEAINTSNAGLCEMLANKYAVAVPSLEKV